jgi:hypothetical protein
LSIDKIDKIQNFIKYLYTFLKNYNLCFLTGTFIFEDFDNRLYNFLTYEDGLLSLSTPNLTLTHNKVLFKKGVKSNEKYYSPLICKNCLKIKLELKFNEKLSYLCDINNENKNTNNKSSKQIILYYRFEYKNKQYLFVKLESHNINSFKHFVYFINQKRYDTYDNRRENRLGYDFKEKDLNFYKTIYINKIIKEDYIEIINEYNNYLRTGNELFVVQELKEYLMDNYEKN